VHFFDFNTNLYDTFLTIELLFFLRDEHKFDTVESLIVQLKKDEKIARDYLKKAQ